MSKQPTSKSILVHLKILKFQNAEVVELNLHFRQLYPRRINSEGIHFLEVPLLKLVSRGENVQSEQVRREYISDAVTSAAQEAKQQGKRDTLC